MDRITKEHRSWNMSRIGGKDTRPETLVRKFLYANGIRYRLHASLPGKPDIVIHKKKIAIFINGCFWHVHRDCQDFRWPQTNSKFWKNKLENNVTRDIKNYSRLKAAGWTPYIIWECNINNKSSKAKNLDCLKDFIEDKKLN